MVQLRGMLSGAHGGGRLGQLDPKLIRAGREAASPGAGKALRVVGEFDRGAEGQIARSAQVIEKQGSVIFGTEAAFMSPE
jgi:hypothetical protein